MINESEASDAGLYVCEATNDAGSLRQNVTLSIGGEWLRCCAFLHHILHLRLLISISEKTIYGNCLRKTFLMLIMMTR